MEDSISILDGIDEFYKAPNGHGTPEAQATAQHSHAKNLFAQIARATLSFRSASETIHDSKTISLSNQILDTLKSAEAELNAAIASNNQPELLTVLRKITIGAIAYSQVYSSYLSQKLSDGIEIKWWKLTVDLILLAAALGFSLLSIMAIVHTVGKPLDYLTGVVEQITKDDLAIELTVDEREDEIGRLTHSLLFLRKALLERRDLLAQQRIVEQKLSVRAVSFGALNDEFQQSAIQNLEGVSGAAEELTVTAKQMSQIAEQALKRTNEAATATVSISGYIARVSEASNNLVIALTQISQQVESSQTTTKGAVKEADGSLLLIGNLALAAERIGTIVGLINSIASKTNLLALMRPSRRRGQAMPAADSPWWPERSSRWRLRPPARPRRSPTRSPRCSRQPTLR